MEIAKKQQILKETFEAEKPSTFFTPQPVADVAQFASQVKWEVKPMEEISIPFTSLNPEAPLLSIPSPPTLTLPSEERLNLFEHLPKDLIIPQQSQQVRLLTAIPTELPSTAPTLSPGAPPAQEKQLTTASIRPETLIANSWNFHPSLEKVPSFFPPPNIPDLPTLVELQTVSFSDAFDTDLVFLPKDDGNGYFFALTLIPRVDLKLPKLRQHYTFLIDRSNSIQSDRLFATKNAVRRALDELDEDDSFNILVFDSKLEKMSSTEMGISPQSRAKAEAFLAEIKLGNFFSSADLYKSLLMTVPAAVKDDELYTTLLFTDGETLGKKTNQRELLHNWSYYNNGRVALFPIAVRTDAHLPILDTAAMFNKGKLFFAPTNRGIKRKALKAMKSIHSPVAKNLSSSAVPLTPQTNVQLYPKVSHLPHLYLNEPYVILGTCDTLDDFILFVQGRLKNKWLNIKKKISFLSAKKGGQSLKSEWALQCAYEHYEAFLNDGNTQHIAEAKAILAPHNLQVALE